MKKNRQHTFLSKVGWDGYRNDYLDPRVLRCYGEDVGEKRYQGKK